MSLNRQPEHELFSPDRPVRSDYSREPNYARRRVITVAVLVLVLVGIGFAIFGGGESETNPADIPTIRAEGDYKQQPANPGGIEIPHQDVRVYEQLEGKGANAPEVEHLLPPPEQPNVIAKEEPPKVADAAPAPAAAPPPPAVSQAEPASVPKPVPTTVAAATPEAKPEPAPAPEPAKPAPAPQKPKAQPPKEALSMDKVIEKVTAKTPVAGTTGSSGMIAVQLASLPDSAQAKVMVQKLQQKYADQLGDVKLHLSRADLGSRGVYYRIQSDSLAKEDANRICSALKKLNAGCIFVGR